MTASTACAPIHDSKTSSGQWASYPDEGVSHPSSFAGRCYGCEESACASPTMTFAPAGRPRAPPSVTIRWSARTDTVQPPAVGTTQASCTWARLVEVLLVEVTLPRLSLTEVPLVAADVVSWSRS